MYLERDSDSYPENRGKRKANVGRAKTGRREIRTTAVVVRRRRRRRRRRRIRRRWRSNSHSQTRNPRKSNALLNLQDALADRKSVRHHL
jgi:hypothetical protein